MSNEMRDWLADNEQENLRNICANCIHTLP